MEDEFSGVRLQKLEQQVWPGISLLHLPTFPEGCSETPNAMFIFSELQGLELGKVKVGIRLHFETGLCCLAQAGVLELQL